MNKHAPGARTCAQTYLYSLNPSWHCNVRAHTHIDTRRQKVTHQMHGVKAFALCAPFFIRLIQSRNEGDAHRVVDASICRRFSCRQPLSPFSFPGGITTFATRIYLHCQWTERGKHLWCHHLVGSKRKREGCRVWITARHTLCVWSGSLCQNITVNTYTKNSPETFLGGMR